MVLGGSVFGGEIGNDRHPSQESISSLFNEKDSERKLLELETELQVQGGIPSLIQIEDK